MMPCVTLHIMSHYNRLMPPDHASHINYHANSSYNPGQMPYGLSVLDLGGV